MTDRTDKEKSKTQACAVPYRHHHGQLEFCVITSSEGRWGFPKGNIDLGESVEQAALKEAFEEAGLHGTILGEPLGSFELEKLGAMLNVSAMLMEVASFDAHWQEADRRQRRWVTADQAREVIGQNEFREMLDMAVVRIESA